MGMGMRKPFELRPKLPTRYSPSLTKKVVPVEAEFDSIVTEIR